MILFPADTLEPSEVERDYRAEWEAARSAGFSTARFDFDGLRRGDAMERVLRRVPLAQTPNTLLYRGWMLGVSDYARLFDGLQARGWNLLNDISAYGFAHHAPENYAFWRDWMPQTAWIEREQFEDGEQTKWPPIFEALRAFGTSPVIVKDWVKSQKYRWNEACFVPDASNQAEVRRVVGRFLELQGDFLTGGLVFRRFESLRRAGDGTAFEWRSFWGDGELLSLAPNPLGDEAPPMHDFQALAKECPSRFWTLDLAQKQDGTWMIVEMGDGGVSGLPTKQTATGFYKRLVSYGIS